MTITNREDLVQNYIDRVVAAIRELNNQFDDWSGDEPSCCVFRELVSIIEELLEESND